MTILAQEILPGTPTTILGAFIAVSMAMIGVIVWLMRHVFVTTIPGILANQQQEREQTDKLVETMRQSNDQTVKSVCATFKEEAAAERKLCEEKFTLVNQSLVALATATIADGKSQVAEINKYTNEAVAQYRHDIHDTINEAVMGRELWLARQEKEKAEAGRSVRPASGQGGQK